LFLRDPMAVFFAVAFPPLLLAILGAAPAPRQRRRSAIRRCGCSPTGPPRPGTTDAAPARPAEPTRVH